MKAAIIAVSALFGVTACDKREAAAEKAREAYEEAREKTAEAARAQEEAAEARQEARDAGAEAAATEESRPYQDGRLVNKDGRMVDENGEVINGETPPMRKFRGEVRQTTRDIGEALGGGSAGVEEEGRQTAHVADWGKTSADRSLNARVREALKQNLAAADEARGVSIRTEDGKVRLIGNVATPEASKAVAEAANLVAGKDRVDNDLQVVDRVGLLSGDRGETEADKRLTERVRAALEADKALEDDADEVHISTVNGEVNLTGTVATPAVSKAIGKVAARVVGVLKVDNDLKISG